MKKKLNEKQKHDETKYAHNPRYAMIVPDANDPDEEVISTGES